MEYEIRNMFEKRWYLLGIIMTQLHNEYIIHFVEIFWKLLQQINTEV